MGVGKVLGDPPALTQPPMFPSTPSLAERYWRLIKTAYTFALWGLASGCRT